MSSPQFFSRSIEQFGGKIPFIVSDTITRLRELNAEKQQGIFRQSGAAGEIRDLCIMLDHGRVKDFSNYDANTIANTFKKFFRDNNIKQPLFPYSIYDEIVSSASKTPFDPNEYRAVLNKISRPRLLTIAYIFKYFSEIAANEATSKMGPSNLAITFGPSAINKLNSTDEEQLSLTQTNNKVIEVLVENYDSILGDIEFDDSMFLTDDEIETLKSPPIDQNFEKELLQLRNLRKKSQIPIIPSQKMEDTSFVRPIE